MKSRLAVSLVFIFIGASFTSNNVAASAKFKLWTHNICNRCPAQVCNCPTSRDCSLLNAVKCNDKDEGTMIHLDGDKPLLKRDCPAATAERQAGTVSPIGRTIGFDSARASTGVGSERHRTRSSEPKLIGSDYHSEALDFVMRAGRQIHEVLGLIRIR